jgi:hypothetical protein
VLAPGAERGLSPQSALGDLQRNEFRPGNRGESHFSKSARSGAPPVIPVNVRRQTRFIFPDKVAPTIYVPSGEAWI